MARLRRARSGYCMLDPTKVTLTTPGIDAAGHLAEMGIPAPVVASYLDNHRVEVEKTGDYSLLVLFSIGTTRGSGGRCSRASSGSSALTTRDNPSPRRSRTWSPPTRTATAT